MTSNDNAEELFGDFCAYSQYDVDIDDNDADDVFNFPVKRGKVNHSCDTNNANDDDDDDDASIDVDDVKKAIITTKPRPRDNMVDSLTESLTEDSFCNDFNNMESSCTSDFNNNKTSTSSSSSSNLVVVREQEEDADESEEEEKGDGDDSPSPAVPPSKTTTRSDYKMYFPDSDTSVQQQQKQQRSNRSNYRTGQVVKLDPSRMTHKDRVNMFKNCAALKYY
jgi:hypothetical protein